MRKHFIETLRTLWAARVTLGATLLLAVGLVLARAFINHFLFSSLMMGSAGAIGELAWLVMNPVLWVFRALIVFFPGLVLFHALAQRASGEPVPFVVSCKAVLTGLPSWFLIAVAFAAARMAENMVVARWLGPWFGFEWFGLFFPGTVGPFIDQGIARLTAAAVIGVVAIPVIARLCLLAPAFAVMHRHRTGTALWLGGRLTTWRDVHALGLFLLLVFVALNVNALDVLRVLTGITGQSSGILWVVVVSSALSTLQLQAAVSLLLAGTIPMWMRVRARAEAEAPAREADPGGFFTRQRVPSVRYIVIGVALIAVHYAGTGFLVLEVMSVGGSGGGLLFSSREAMDAGIPWMFGALNLPLLPLAVFGGPLPILLGGVAWAVIIILALEAVRRIGRYRARARANRAEG